MRIVGDTMKDLWHAVAQNPPWTLKLFARSTTKRQRSRGNDNEGQADLDGIAVALEGSVGVTEWDAKVGVTLVYSQLGLLFLFLATHDDVRQAPRIFAELNLQIAVLIDYQLCRRVQHAGALLLVLIVDVDFAAGKVVGLRLSVMVGLLESDPAVGDEAYYSTGAGGRR